MGMRANRKKTGARDYRSYLLIGGKGQGKSTLLIDLVEEYLQSFANTYSDGIYPRAFIHDMSSSRAFRHLPTVEQACQKLELDLEDPLELLTLKDKKGQPVWKKGALRYVCRKGREIQHMHEMLAAHFRNGMVVFDEWTTYVRANPPDWQIDIVNNHRNYGLEVFFVCHQIMRVPLFFIRGDMIAKIILFKTGESELEYRQFRRYSCAEQLWKAYERVLAAPETNKWVQYHEIIDV